MKKSKKFVLAGLVLLAITGLLALSGCKNDTVPETPEAKQEQAGGTEGNNDTVPEPTRYTVKFETAHGTAPADITVVSGTKLTAEQLKVLDSTDNYIFEGWYGGETKAEGGTYTVTKDVTLVAKWRDRGTVASVTFTLAGATVTLSTDTAGATTRYTTDGTDPKTSETRQEGNSVSITQQTTVKAYATKEGLKDSDVAARTYCVVTFDANGGSEVAPQVVESGKAANNPTDPTNGDKVLAGWYTSADGGTTLADTAYSFDTPVAGDITLYAWWLPKPGTVVSDGLTIGEIKLEKTSEVQVLSKEVYLEDLYQPASNSQIFVDKREDSIQPFVMGQYEVTQQLYLVVMGSNPSEFTSDVAAGETQELRPVERVSWYDAVVFCNELSELMGLEPVYCKGGQTDTSKWGRVPTSSNEGWNAITCNWNANGYRLPTEAEWELAARGGDPGAGAWQNTYAGSDTIDDVAWYYNNIGNDVGKEQKTHQVGTKDANSLGLHDMSGNVWEWCWDWDGSIEAGTPSGGAASGTYRVLRGGSWYNGTSDSKVFNRSGDYPSFRLDYMGFRLVRSAN